MPKKISGNWTEPQISPKNTNDKTAGTHCYVWFRYLVDGKWSHPIKRKPAISLPFNKRNHYLDLKALIKVIKIKLEEGWNPITGAYAPGKEQLSQVERELAAMNKMSLVRAVVFAWVKKKSEWRPRTIQSHKSVIRHLLRTAKELGLSTKPVSEFTLPHFKLLLETVKEKRKLSAKGFNKYRSYLSSLVSEMMQWQIVTENLIEHVTAKTPQKTNAHRLPTADERTLILQRVRQYPNYFRFIAVMYGTTLRPEEITKLQIKHLHKKEGVFKLSGDHLKDKEPRTVVLPNWVMDLLMELNLQNYPPDYYIFSTFNKYRSFLPGPNKMHVYSTQRFWKKIIKDKETGLGIDVDQYAFKKMAGDDMIKIQRQVKQLLELPRVQMGHSSSRMTEIYVSEHQKDYKHLIQTQMPEL